jgi:hypothetical protein
LDFKGLGDGNSSADNSTSDTGLSESDNITLGVGIPAAIGGIAGLIALYFLYIQQRSRKKEGHTTQSSSISEPGEDSAMDMSDLRALRLRDSPYPDSRQNETEADSEPTSNPCQTDRTEINHSVAQSTESLRSIHEWVTATEWLTPSE